MVFVGRVSCCGWLLMSDLVLVRDSLILLLSERFPTWDVQRYGNDLRRPLSIAIYKPSGSEFGCGWSFMVDFHGDCAHVYDSGEKVVSDVFELCDPDFLDRVLGFITGRV